MKRLMITVAMVMAPAAAFAMKARWYVPPPYLYRLRQSFLALFAPCLLLGLLIYAVYGLASRDVPSKSKFIWMAVVIAFALAAPLLAALDARNDEGWNPALIGGILFGFLPPLSLFILNQKLRDSLRVALAVAMLPFSVVLTILFIAWWVWHGPGMGGPW